MIIWNKSVCGLHQGSLSLSKLLAIRLKEFSFDQWCVFTLSGKTKNAKIFLEIHVDDIIVAGSSIQSEAKRLLVHFPTGLSLPTTEKRSGATYVALSNAKELMNNRDDAGGMHGGDCGTF